MSAYARLRAVFWLTVMASAGMVAFGASPAHAGGEPAQLVGDPITAADLLRLALVVLGGGGIACWVAYRAGRPAVDPVDAAWRESRSGVDLEQLRTDRTTEVCEAILAAGGEGSQR